MANEFLVERVVVFKANAAATLYAGVYIPAGAIINGISAFVTGDQTNLAAASATFQLRVGTDSICSAITFKQLAAQTKPVALTMNNSAGVYVPNSGELNLIMQASQNSSYVGPPTFYVGYMVK
jgi:hypothetical protein